MIDNRLIDITNLAEYDLLLKEYIQSHISDITLYNTSDYWESCVEFIPKEGQIIVYSDALSFGGKSYPMLKVGDGKAYLIDLPFMNEATLKNLKNHLENNTIHITQSEREKWNTAVTTTTTDEQLIFNYVN